MTIRSWVAGRLRDAYVIELEGEHGLRITRETLPVALVYCAETNGIDRFTVDDLDAARRDIPGVQFVVLVRRDADNGAYERAEELGICLSGFGGLQSALAGDFNIAHYLSREQAYLRSRLGKNRHVSSVRRCGKSAYEISRKGVLPPVTIVTTDDYELTSDSVYELLDDNDSIEIDAIVSTNPACWGFAGEVVHAGERTGIWIFSLNELLDALGKNWT
jgi:hypothetical protein